MMKNNLIQTKLLDLLFPPRCIFCRAPLSQNQSPLTCSTCMDSLPVTAGSGCFEGTKHTAYVIAPFYYKDTVRRAILDFKYHNRVVFAETLAHFMLQRLQQIDEVKKLDLIIPVPLSTKRMRKRGYNQAGLLADFISRGLNIPCEFDLLIRTRDTRVQNRLNSIQRAQNVQQAFGCTEALEGKSILLIDDIYTSGATLNSCAYALKNVGASKVIAATVAIVEKSSE